MTQFLAPGEAETAARLRGIAFLCLAVFLFTVLDTAAKYAGRAVPTIEVAWARYAINLLLIVIVLRPWTFPARYRTGRPVAQTIRALFLLASTVFNFAALRYLQLAETVSIAFAAPLLVTALAGPLLGEWAGPRRWAAVIAGFIGVIIILEPDPERFRPEALFSVGAAFSYAGYALMTRLLSASESPTAMLFFGATARLAGRRRPGHNRRHGNRRPLVSDPRLSQRPDDGSGAVQLHPDSVDGAFRLCRFRRLARSLDHDRRGHRHRCRALRALSRKRTPPRMRTKPQSSAILARPHR